MPFGYALYAYPYLLAEQQFEERQLMQADDDGMLERFIVLEGIKTPRMLSWAEERALRRDLVDGAHAVLNGLWRTRYRSDPVAFTEDFWPIYDDIAEHHKYLMHNMTSEEWRAQYLQTPKSQEWCRCGDQRMASCSKPHRIGGERYFGCHTCGLPIYGEERY